MTPLGWNTLTEEKSNQFEHRRVDSQYLSEKIKDFSQYFYICGPDPMIESIKNILLKMGVKEDKIVTEEF